MMSRASVGTGSQWILRCLTSQKEDDWLNRSGSVSMSYEEVPALDAFLICKSFGLRWGQDIVE
jgi:hypothetical protein